MNGWLLSNGLYQSFDFLLSTSHNGMGPAPLLSLPCVGEQVRLAHCCEQKHSREERERESVCVCVCLLFE